MLKYGIPLNENIDSLILAWITLEVTELFGPYKNILRSGPPKNVNNQHALVNCVPLWKSILFMTLPAKMLHKLDCAGYLVGSVNYPRLIIIRTFTLCKNNTMV